VTLKPSKVVYVRLPLKQYAAIKRDIRVGGRIETMSAAIRRLLQAALGGQ
jgi:Arc/MetJ-type ribon-helix-helix transcriptional regulator